MSAGRSAILEVEWMPDFDQFERLVRAAMVSDGSDSHLGRVAQGIATLPQFQVPGVAKARSASEIAAWLMRCWRSLRDAFGGEGGFSTSDDNRFGRDLLEIESGTPVELKSGDAKTDAQIGLGSAAWTFGDDDPEALRRIVHGSMLERRALIVAGQGRTAVEESKRQTMDQLYEYLARRLTPGGVAPERLAHTARCVASGYTTGDEIRRLWGEGIEGSVAMPKLFKADWERGFVEFGQRFLPGEEVRVRDLVRTDRVMVRVEGAASGRTALFYPNYKNSYHDSRTGQVIPADNWVQTPCFHVWIDR